MIHPSMTLLTFVVLVAGIAFGPARLGNLAALARAALGAVDHVLRLVEGVAGGTSEDRPAGPAPVSGPESGLGAGPLDGPTSAIAHLVYEGEQLGSRLVPGRPWTVGRTPSLSHIMLPHRLVSRRHCQLSDKGQGWQVLDLTSMNGTYVNGRRVTRASLRDGDRISFGDPGPTVEFRIG